jgi:phage shock protein PspC (stress-responsive transcriptional regulator)
MEKTIKINLAGVLFHIEETAYYILRDYLQAIDRHFHNIPGGIETIEDIESRIAEIFRTQHSIAGVISKENVEAMIGIIGNPDDFDQPGNQQERPYVAAGRRRLYRNPDNSIISGVCGGIGAYLNIDAVWVRLIFILFAFMFGTGFFVYIALWIALPGAVSEIQKKELYGSNYNYRASTNVKHEKGNAAAYSNQSAEPNSIGRVGGVFDEVFRALGRFFFIFFRIIMIIFGVFFVLAGFSALLALIMGFFFKYPGFISMGSVQTNLFYLPDLLNCIVNPSLTPWILFLILLVIILPLMAIIYWGIKMIFWFRARDGILSLIFLVVWVLSITALCILLFNEGITFSETGRSTSTEVFATPPDTLQVVSVRKSKDLEAYKEISLPDSHYAIFISDSSRKLSVGARLSIISVNDKQAKVEIFKQSFGRTKIDAVKKAESLIFGCRISNDTLYIDEYFTLPYGSKWTGDELEVNLYLPEKTVLHFDNTSGDILTERFFYKNPDDDESSYSSGYIHHNDNWRPGNKYWIFSNDEFKEVERAKVKSK